MTPQNLILVVDDHPVTREPLARLLRHEGYDAACAANGAEALDSVKARRPNLVLLDLLMPKMDGLAFLEAVRRDDACRDLPVIVVTAGLNPNQLRRARELNAVDVIPKLRFRVEELLDKVRQALAADGGARKA